MRAIQIILCLLFVPASLYAQQWIEYSSDSDFFFVNFHTNRQLRKSLTYTSKKRRFPARLCRDARIEPIFRKSN